LECTWCDTAYTWAFTPDKAARTESGIQYSKEENIHPMSVGDVLVDLEKLWPIYDKPTMIVISGGEPLIQAKKLEPLVQKLCNLECEVHIETAGTLKPTEFLDRYVAQYNVSPKLSHSGNRTSKRYRPQVLQWFAQWEKSWFKFVIRNLGDFVEIDQMVRECSIDTRNVMVMPEGITIDKNIGHARLIAEAAIERGYGISFRTHILLWKDVRGK
jgi:organic radical activating enzyme